MASILVVEDEADVASFIVEALNQEGHKVELEENGRIALSKILHKAFDLVVLDVSLPDLDGFEILNQMRRTVKTPVLILTARRRVDDRVRGLEGGADDYLTKPFELAEFLARIRAVLRRSEMSRGVLEYSNLWLDPLSRNSKRGNRKLYLSNTEFALLELLFAHPGEPVSKRELLMKVWDNDETRDPNLVEVYIGYLRTKLEAGGEPRLIQTARGKGYFLSESPYEE